MKKTPIWYVVGLVGITFFAWALYPRHTTAPTIVNTNTHTAVTNTTALNTNSATIPNGMISFSTADLPERDPAFSFSMNIFSAWRAEFLTAAKAINVYELLPIGSSLDNSRMFIRYYTADKISTRDVVAGSATTVKNIQNQSGQEYTAPAKTTKLPTGYPSWWTLQHQVIEVQTGSASPYTFFVFDFSPTVTSAQIISLISSTSF